jgi:hypothetical protein
MSAEESVFDRAHRLEHEAREAARADAGRAPDAVAAHLARLEAQIAALLHEVQALRATLARPPAP